MSANKLLQTRAVLALVLTLALALAGGMRPSQAAMELGPQVHFDIAAQQLPSALLQFSAQSGVQVTSPGQLVEGKRSPGVVGTFSPGKALALLLKDTALVFDIVDHNTVVITGSAIATSHPQPALRDLQKISDPPV